MQEEPRQRGRRPIPEEQKKRSYTLSFTPAEAAELEAQAAKAGENTSQFVVTRLKLNKAKRH